MASDDQIADIEEKHAEKEDAEKAEDAAVDSAEHNS